MTAATGQLKASIIIPTFNRREALWRLLSALDRQSYPRDRFEVIIADDGSTDGTTEMLRSAASWFGFPIRFCRTPRIGPGPARNTAAQVARGGVLLFTDSDCEPDARWLDAILHALEYGVIVCGKVEAPADGSWVGKCVNYILSTWLGGAGKEWRLWGLIPGRRLRTLNAGMARHVFLELGGFRPDALHYGEDTELGERALRCGHSLYGCERAVVVHREDRCLLDYVLEFLARGLAIVWLIRKGTVQPRVIYALPALLWISLCGVIVAAPLGYSIVVACLTVWIVYLSAVFGHAARFSIRCKSVAPLGVLPVTALALHLAYGMGTLLGLLRVSPPRKGTRIPEILPGRA